MLFNPTRLVRALIGERVQVVFVEFESLDYDAKCFCPRLLLRRAAFAARKFPGRLKFFRLAHQIQPTQGFTETRVFDVAIGLNADFYFRFVCWRGAERQLKNEAVVFRGVVF